MIRFDVNDIFLYFFRRTIFFFRNKFGFMKSFSFDFVIVILTIFNYIVGVFSDNYSRVVFFNRNFFINYKVYIRFFFSSEICLF